MAKDRMKDKGFKRPERGDTEGFKRPNVDKKDLERGYKRPDS